MLLYLVPLIQQLDEMRAKEDAIFKLWQEFIGAMAVLFVIEAIVFLWPRRKKGR
jgi:hypothetical protein